METIPLILTIIAGVAALGVLWEPVGVRGAALGVVLLAIALIVQFN